MDIENFALFISKRRKELNLTQQDLADMIGVTNKAVSKWERGLSIPDITVFKHLARSLDVEVLDLLSAGDLLGSEKVGKKEVESLMEKAFIVMQNFNLKKLISIIYMIAMMGLSLGLFVTLGIDLIMNQTITWSLITTTAILGAMLIISTIRFTYENLAKCIFLTAFVSILVAVPIVFSTTHILQLNNIFNRNFLIFITTAVVSILIAYTYFHFSKSHLWIKLHVSAIIVDTINSLVQVTILPNKLLLLPNLAGIVILLTTLPLTMSYVKKQK